MPPLHDQPTIPDQIAIHYQYACLMRGKEGGNAEQDRTEAAAWCQEQFGPDLVDVQEPGRRESRAGVLGLFLSWRFNATAVNASAYTYFGRIFYFKHLNDAILFKLYWG